MEPSFDLEGLLEAVSDLAAIGSGGDPTEDELVRGGRALAAAVCRLLGPGLHRDLPAQDVCTRVVHGVRQVPFRKLERGLGLRLYSFQMGDVVLNDPGTVDGQPAAGRRPLLWTAFSHGFSGMFRVASDREVLRAVPAIAIVAQAALAREESRVTA